MVGHVSLVNRLPLGCKRCQGGLHGLGLSTLEDGLPLTKVERLEEVDLEAFWGRDQLHFWHVKFEILLRHPSGSVQLNFQLKMLIWVCQCVEGRLSHEIIFTDPGSNGKQGTEKRRGLSPGPPTPNI